MILGQVYFRWKGKQGQKLSKVVILSEGLKVTFGLYMIV